MESLRPASSAAIDGWIHAFYERVRSMWFSRERPFVFWLVVVQLAAVLPVLVFSAFLMHQIVASDEAEAISNLKQRAMIAADAVGREADRVKMTLQLLSGQDAARSGDVAAVRRLAVRLVEMDPSIAGASALDRSGQLIFTTYRPDGTVLPRIPLNPGAATVFEHEQTYVSGLTPGGLNDVTLIGFATPWRVDGKVQYSLRMAIKPSALGYILKEQRWPDTWTAALIDQNMAIVARSRDEAANFGKPASPSLQQLISAQGASVGRSLTKDGIDAVTVVVKVPGTPWWLAAGLPYAELRAGSNTPMLQLLAGGLGLMLIGVVLSYLLGKRLNQDLIRVAQGQATGGSQIRELRALDVQRLMLDNELIGMVRLKERRSVWQNRALEKIFQYEPGELDGHSPRLMHVDDESFEALGKQAYPVLRSGEPYRTQLQMIRKDGSRLWADVSGIALAHGETLWMIVDISAMKADQIRAEQLAFHDHLTGLPNRALLVDRLRLALPAAERAGQTVVVAFIDLNGFKAVNDTYGHAAGDLLLRTVSERLQVCVRAQDTVARLGGDEFVLLLTQLRDRTDAEVILARVRLEIAQPVHTDGKQLHVSAAVGSACFPGDGVETPDDLLSTADRRMYEDKQARQQRT